MKKNLGSTDRVIRLVLAVTFAILYFTNTITGTTGLVLMILAAVFAVTSLIRFCPIYYALGLHSNKLNPKT